jgi:phosphotriesterase-related protein
VARTLAALAQGVASQAIGHARIEGVADDPGAERLAKRDNHVVGTGYYVCFTHPPDMDRRSEGSLADEMIADITEGIGPTGIRCGIIGELGCEVLSENELKVLRAGARAQRATGATISVHTMFLYTGREGGLRIADELEAAGADLSRVVFCHQDGSGVDLEYQRDLLHRGINLEYDVFGFEVAFMANGILAQWPTDTQRIQELKRLIDDGWISQILISQDICMKSMTRKYGGWGYAHILESLRPRFAAAGITADYLARVMIDNPQRLLALV